MFLSLPPVKALIESAENATQFTNLIQQAGLERTEAHTGAVTLIQRFGSAANLNIHLHCLLLDGVYRTTEGLPVFHKVGAPAAEQLHAGRLCAGAPFLRTAPRCPSRCVSFLASSTMSMMTGEGTSLHPSNAVFI